jgi:hypothetical protein
MCDVVAALSVGGAIFGAIGQIQQASHNAAVANANAQQAIISANADEQKQRDQVRRILGAQQAGYGGAGVAVDSGSALDVAADTAAQGEVDALTIRYNGRLRANAAQSQAAAYQASIPGAILTGAVNAGTGIMNYKAPVSDPTSLPVPSLGWNH